MLRTYYAKRNFRRTSEPRGKRARCSGDRYVIHKHAARRLHYDLRLELEGVLKSWAVTHGPSLVAGDRRLAVEVEDHPVEYSTFEGAIPLGEYGGGTVMIWDIGRWKPIGDAHAGLLKGHLEFELFGKKLKGRWHLVRMKRRRNERQTPWLLIKADDEFARRPSDPDILEEMPDSAASGRSMEQIAQAEQYAAPTEQAAPHNRGRTSASRRWPSSNKLRPGRIAGARMSKQPEFFAPCLATLCNKPPPSTDWVHEIKFDGYRIQARITKGTVALKTRTGLDWTAKFPSVARACAALAPHDATLDGEIVSINENGVPAFSNLQDDLKTGRQDRLVYFVFDLLYLDRYDLTGATLIARKSALAVLLAGMPKNGVLRLSEHFEVDGALMLERVCAMHLEGIVSKLRHARYRSGRVGDWLKIKCSASQEFIVIGYEPSARKPRLIRSLLLGYYGQGKLQYAGRVGTGWGSAEERELLCRLAEIQRASAALAAVPPAERGRKVVWVEPRLVVEVGFRGWTRAGLVRQGAYKGIREDKPVQQVVRENGEAAKATPAKSSTATRPAMKSNSRAVAPHCTAVAGVTLTHPERVYWDDAGVNKRMLAEYYAEVWEWMRPHVVDRVLTLLRCPQGRSVHCFFQKHVAAGLDPAHLRLVTEPDGEQTFAIETLPGLIALVQVGALEVHVRGSTLAHLEEADRLVFDLDPGPGVGWHDLVGAAREVRQRLRAHGLESFAKVTGGNGVHVVLPIRHAHWDAAKSFCRGLATRMAADSPNRYTATATKSARPQRIFIDYLRNSREATSIAPYSTRARPGATVAIPVSWEELSSLPGPNAFTVHNVMKRLSRLRRDPWEEMSRLRQRLPPGA